jgi:hypothetical protein
MENTEENSEKIWKIQKKIVKRNGKYGRKASRMVINMKNMEENDLENMEEKTEKI